MTEPQVLYRAIDAACCFNLEQSANGYGCDSVALLSTLVDEFAAIARAFPEMDRVGLVEFYELHCMG